MSLFLLTVFALANASEPVTVSRPMGKLFEPDAAHKNPVFEISWTSETKTEGADKTTVLKTTYREPGTGNVVVFEEVHLKNGVFESYRQKHNQLGKEGYIEHQGDKVIFNYGDASKDIQARDKSDEDWDPRFVVGPMLVERVQENWDKLMKGDDLEVRFGVPDRRETVGFKLFKIDDKDPARPEGVVIKMKPSSIIIAALVKSLRFTFSKDGKKLLGMKGRSLPKIFKDGKWHDFDAEVDYD